MSAVEEYLAAGREAALADLVAFCRIPSVSADPAYAEGIDRAAQWVADRMVRAGFDTVERIETGGHPAVLGEAGGDPGRPTVVVYGHYDVQPPEPFARWRTPPFEPTLADDRLYARGVSDDKGPLLIPILVAEAFLKTEGRLPVNLKVLIEGEEESGSPHFESTVARLKQRLSCDLVVSADCAMWRPDRPSITVATRGLVALDVTVTGAAKDLHSGRHGGSAPNPIRALVRLLASLHDDDGRVAVAGFMAGAKTPDPGIGTAIEAAQFDPSAYYDEIGASPPAPLPTGLELLTRQWLEPTLEFNGITGGYAGPGTKTVIPASAGAKITCRLIAGQQPDQVATAIERHLQARRPGGYGLEIKRYGPGSEAFAIAPDLPALSLAEDVLEEMLGRRPLRVAMGATVPIGTVFARQLGVGTVFFSFSTSDEDYHAPNEFLRLSNFRAGQIAWARLLQRLNDRRGTTPTP